MLFRHVSCELAAATKAKPLELTGRHEGEAGRRD